MFHARIQRFDGMDEKILGGEGLTNPVENGKKIPPCCVPFRSLHRQLPLSCLTRKPL